MHTTTDLLEAAAPATISSEVAAYAAEPSKVEMSAAVLPEDMVSTAVSSEMAALASVNSLPVL